MSESTAMRPGHVDLVIVGGGAAGLVAAIAAARAWHDRPRHVRSTPIKIIILEKNDKIGRKILATGNGRCNLTNALAVPDSYHGHEPRFCMGALHRYDVKAILDFFMSLGLVCREEEDGRIYPACQQAAAVVDVLHQELERLSVVVMTGTTVCSLETLQPVYLGNRPLDQTRTGNASKIELKSPSIYYLIEK